jgi:hypothetical protein
MKSIGILALTGLCLLLTSVQAQCSQYVYGIPVCTGFCLDNDSSSMTKWMDGLGASLDSIHQHATRMQDSLVRNHVQLLRKTMDSIRKQIKTVKDSLDNYEGGGNMGEIFSNPDFKNFFTNGDSIVKNWNWKREMPELPNIPHNKFFYRLPKPEQFKVPFPESKEQNTIKNFKGWRYDKLASL